MTKKEALVASLQVSVPDMTLEKTLIDSSMDGSAAYTAADAQAVDLCAVKILSGLLAVPNITEGGMSVTYDRNGIRSRLLSLARQYGLTDVLAQLAPVVNSRAVW